MTQRDETSKAGQRAAIWIAGVGVFWIGANVVGGYLGWTSRTQALFDLMALAGFAAAIWAVFNIWRKRQ